MLSYCTHPTLLPGSPFFLPSFYCMFLFEARLARNVLDLFKLGAHLDNRVAYQTGVQAHCAAQRVLCAGAGVEAHDEVVADVVGGLQLLRGLGQQEGAPVGDAAHDAVLLEDDLAGRLCDSGGKLGEREAMEGWGLLEGWVFTL